MTARGRIAAAGSAYCVLVFLCGFAFGTVRTLLIAPRIGPLAAVAAELPFVLAVSFFAAGALMRRFAITSRREAIAMGALAFCLLMATEVAVAALFGTPTRLYLASFATAQGALGLCGQVLFALIPAARVPTNAPQ